MQSVWEQQPASGYLTVMANKTKKNTKFKMGDVVGLKSGGPTLTITQIYDHVGLQQQYECTRDLGGHFIREMLPEDALHLVPEDHNS